VGQAHEMIIFGSQEVKVTCMRTKIDLEARGIVLDPLGRVAFLILSLKWYLFC